MELKGQQKESKDAYIVYTRDGGMKINVTHTYDLSDEEVKALKLYWKEVREEGETFREWLRSYHTAAGTHYVYDKMTEYWEWRNES